MDFELNEDETALQEGIRAFCGGRFPIETVRELEATGGVDRGRWAELGETGVFGLRVAESDGGVGLGLTEAALVFEELGRAVVPGPLLASHLAAGLVDGALDGSVVVGAIERPATPLLVEHLDSIDVLLAIDEDGVHAVEVDDLNPRPVESMDPLTPMHQVAELPVGTTIADASIAAEWRQWGATQAAAQLLGRADGALQLAVAYAKEREQFGRPIGSFQAVKHLCADMLTRVELARSAVYAAAVTLDGRGVDDPQRMVAAAKITAGEAAVANGKSCIQVHGGMGFTAEVDAHFYLKRAFVLDTWFGSVDAHAEAVAATL
jgi:alkylation response protein AidB-like acyl-CoA dehydrogenase